MTTAPHPTSGGTENLQALRDYYDNNDQSAELEEATYDDEVIADPMVTTSLRLPRSLLQWVRNQAEAEQVKPTALLRRWVEERRAADSYETDKSVDDRLAALEVRTDQLAASLARFDPQPPPDSTARTPGQEVCSVWTERDINEIADAPVVCLRGVSEADAQHLKDAFNIKTLRDLGTNKYFLWAQGIAKLAE